jgi:hypothetical protein
LTVSCSSGVKGGRRGLAEDFHAAGAQLDLAGGEPGVLAALALLVDAAAGDDAFDAEDPLGAESAGVVAGLHAALVGVEDDLGEPVAVAQVDEDDAAVVPVIVDPAGEPVGLADVGLAEGAAGDGAVAGFDGFHGCGTGYQPVVFYFEN